MSSDRRVLPLPDVVYPESDDLPMAEHPLQEQWIVRLGAGLRYLLGGNPQAYVAVDNFWYPVEGQNKICTAPDVYVVLGRPARLFVDGRPQIRGCYKQWLEDGVAPQVVFEVRSPSNTDAILEEKRQFYERYGVEEYYLIDPFRNEFSAWWRGEGDHRGLEPIDTSRPLTSPRLGIHFVPGPEELSVLHPDGQAFRDPLEIQLNEDRALRRAEEAERRAEEECQRAEGERRRVEESERRAEEERRRAEEALARLAALEERLRDAARGGNGNGPAGMDS
jgi:Uma2 family endonuclease